jgi:cytochrome P450
LFEFVEPLIGKKSIQFANGSDGMKRHKIAVEALGHQVSSNVFSQFIDISKELNEAWKSFNSEEHIPLNEYMISLAIRMISATQFGSYFRTAENIKSFAKLYDLVMTDMDDLLIGEFNKEDSKRYEKFEKNLTDFKVEIKKLLDVHKKAR